MPPSCRNIGQLGPLNMTIATRILIPSTTVCFIYTASAADFPLLLHLPRDCHSVAVGRVRDASLSGIQGLLLTLPTPLRSLLLRGANHPKCHLKVGVDLMTFTVGNNASHCTAAGLYMCGNACMGTDTWTGVIECTQTGGNEAVCSKSRLLLAFCGFAEQFNWHRGQWQS